MTRSFTNVQRIVLHGSAWRASQQLVLRFPKGAQPLRFVHLLKPKYWPTAAGVRKPPLQVSLGFSRPGLEAANVPPNVLARFFLKSPAFFAGAALRAGSQLGASGINAPERWDEAFGFTTLHAVLSLHANGEDDLRDEVAGILAIAGATQVEVLALPVSRRLEKPDSVPPAPDDAQFVHFGYRDALSRVGIKGWNDATRPGRYLPISLHEAGEFLLGHPQDCGANPWLADPTGEVWPDALRAFFRDGSFGVLHQMQQYVDEFEAFVDKAATSSGIEPDELKAKLCGRRPDGQPLAQDAAGFSAGDDFDYSDDPDGLRCPFGSHMRRMNPRNGAPVETSRTRSLLRRGMPFGRHGEPEVGLIGQFFCASIEDQFEHLLGQWADRVPLGSQDRGQARDPLAGAHEPGDGGFEIPRQGRDSLMLAGMSQFTRTRGTAYLFYPSLTTLQGIADSSLWGAGE